MAKEFFDTAELCLNQESEGVTAWANLGYWQQAETYPQACENLARLLANQAQLKATDAVLDLGFGLGEQLLLWRDQYAIKSLLGINPSLSQCEFAKQAMGQHAYPLRCATAEHFLTQNTVQFDKILAVDCAYHFQQQGLFAQIAQALRQHGLFAWTDLYLPQTKLSRRQQVAVQLVCRASRIPPANLRTLPQYRRFLQQQGLCLDVHEDLSEQVFSPFAQWWASYIRRFPMPLHQRLKYDVSSAAFRQVDQRQILRYGLFIAHRS